MKIKDRPLTPLLIKQIKRQEERIKACGDNASLRFITLLYTFTGSIYSTRFKI